MMKKRLKITGCVIVGVILLYVTFMAGKFSYLITQPEALLTPKEQWFVEKARQYARDEKIPDERLKTPKVVDTVRVYFGGMAGMGGVEVTMLKVNGMMLEASH